MPENKHLRFLLCLLYAALAAGGLWLTVRFLLRWLLPFLLAFGLSALLEPVVRLLTVRLRLRRWAAAAIGTAVLSAGLLGGLGLLLWRVGYELTLLLKRFPTLLAGLPTLTDRLEDWVYRFLIALPVQLQEPVRDGLEGLVCQGAALPDQLYSGLLAAVTGAASALPAAALFLFTTLLATYFTSASRPGLLAALASLLPDAWQVRGRRAAASLKEALGGWLKAQGLLMLITFGELAAGLLFLQAEPALLLAALIALVDALPVFGTGTILLPWAAFALLGGHVGRGLGLAVLYGVITLVRNLLEPKLVGAKAGLPPLAALASLYVGFQIFGVLGMILAPLAAAVVCRLWASDALAREHQTPP